MNPNFWGAPVMSRDLFWDSPEDEKESKESQYEDDSDAQFGEEN
jgi:hypothetical protein